MQRPRGAAPRPDRGQRGGPPLHRPLLPGRLQGHPQRRRHRRASPTPSRSRAGRTARRTSCSSAATSRARACSTCSRPTASCARPATRTGCWSSAPGPQEREARRYVATRGLQGGRVPGPRHRRGEGAALPDRRRVRLAGDRRRIVRDRPARGDGRRHADRRLGHPRLQGRRPARPRGPAGPAARAQGARDGHRPAARRPGAAGRDGRRRPGARRGVQLAAGDRQGRGLLRLRHPPPGGRPARCPRTSGPPIPQAPPVRARPSGIVGRVRAGRGLDSASASRQTQAE